MAFDKSTFDAEVVKMGGVVFPAPSISITPSKDFVQNITNEAFIDNMKTAQDKRVFCKSKFGGYDYYLLNSVNIHTEVKKTTSLNTKEGTKMELPTIPDAWKRIIVHSAMGGILAMAGAWAATGNVMQWPVIIGCILKGLIAFLTDLDGAMGTPQTATTSTDSKPPTGIGAWMRHV